MAASFPVEGLLPKHEIQAAAFIQQYPHYNGHGIRVGILDTGVDPAAAGMGPNKVVDIIDCSGSGDVHMKTVEPVTSKNAPNKSAIYIPSLTGRLLSVSPQWKNPSGVWRVGHKRAWEFWPDELVWRRVNERKHNFEKKHNTLLTQALSDLEEFKAQQKLKPKSTSSSNSKSETSSSTATKTEEKVKTDKEKATESTEASAQKDSPPSPEPSLKLREKELETRVQALKDLASNRSDQGPILEVVSWHDGDAWRCVVGAAEGDLDDTLIDLPLNKDEEIIVDLQDKKPMTDYRVERHYETFGTRDLLTYSVNILNEGETVSLVTLSGAHGTHVAGIVGAHHPNSPELNGVAPGVEIVSIKISDARVGTMETHQALVRACKAIIDSKCDIVNMSFGEASCAQAENKGQFIQQIRDEVIRKRDVLFISSAGNAGPGLSSVGAPAGTTDGIVSVGAYVTSSMQKAEYALLDNVPSGAYTWTSRGPTADGYRGVTVMSPGAAITSVPKYGLHVTQLMNGTSMASPSACGGISLVLSALKQLKIPYTSSRIEKALGFASKDINDEYTDAGLLQVDQLFQYIKEHKDLSDQDAVFNIGITPVGKNSGRSMRGVYLRGEQETRQTFQGVVSVTPSFKEEETERTYNLELKLKLAASQPWVKVPEFLVLAHNGRTFNINVLPENLSPGFHRTEIIAYDTSTPGRKVFTIPVVVTKPLVPDGPRLEFNNMTFEPGHVERRWVSVPKGATRASFKATSQNNTKPLQLWLSLNQIQPLKRHDSTEKSAVVNMNDGEPFNMKMPVTSALPLEITLVQGWNSISTGQVSLEVEFSGILELSSPSTNPQDAGLVVTGGKGLQTLSVYSELRVEKFEPKVAFHSRRKFIRPAQHVIKPLTSRDKLLTGKQLLELQLTYDFKLSAPKKVTLSWPTSGTIYDSPFGILAFVYDENKRLVKALDVYDKKLSLSKGDYKVKLQIVNESYDVLDKTKALPMSMDFALEGTEADVGLDFYWDHVDALSNVAATFTGTRVFPGENVTFIVKTELSGSGRDALLKEASSGDLLCGNITVSPKVATKEGTKLYYVIPPAPHEDTGSSVKDSQTPPLLVDLQLGIVSKIDNETERREYLDSIVKKHPDHLPTLVAKLNSLKESTEDDKKVESENEIIAACDAILEKVGENGEDELARYYGCRRPEGSEQTKEEKDLKRQMETTKDAIKKAYDRKLLILLARDRQKKAEVDAKKETDETSKATSLIVQLSPETETIWKCYDRWLDPFSSSKDVKSGLCEIRRELARGRPGVALSTANDVIKHIGPGSADADATAANELRKKALKDLGWSLWEREEANADFVRRPPGGYQEF